MARVDQDWGVGERQDGNAKEEEAGGEKKERRLGGKRERSCISKVCHNNVFSFFYSQIASVAFHLWRLLHV